MDENNNTGFNESTENNQGAAQQPTNAGQNSYNQTQNPNGQNPYGQNPNNPNQNGPQGQYDQNQYGQYQYGQQGQYGQNQYAQNQYGQQGQYGPNQYGQNPYGQQPYGQDPYRQYEDMRPKAPNAVASLVLGICSIIFTGVGLICGIIGLILANRGIDQCSYAPQQFRNYGMLKAGRILSIIGIALAALKIIMVILVLAFATTVGGAACCSMWPFWFLD